MVESSSESSLMTSVPRSDSTSVFASLFTTTVPLSLLLRVPAKQMNLHSIKTYTLKKLSYINAKSLCKIIQYICLLLYIMYLMRISWLSHRFSSWLTRDQHHHLHPFQQRKHKLEFILRFLFILSNVHMHNTNVIFLFLIPHKLLRFWSTTLFWQFIYHLILVPKILYSRKNCQSFLEKSKCLFTEKNSFNKLSKYLFI